jgi:hypothetical protein
MSGWGDVGMPLLENIDDTLCARIDIELTSRSNGWASPPIGC